MNRESIARPDQTKPRQTKQAKHRFEPQREATSSIYLPVGEKLMNRESIARPNRTN